MKKLASKSRRPPRRKRRDRPRDTLVKGVDLTLIRQLLADALPFDEEPVEEMVENLLTTQPESPDDLPGAEALSDLDEALNRLRLEAAWRCARARDDEIRASND